MNPRNLAVYGPVESLAPTRENIVLRRPLVRKSLTPGAYILPELGYSREAIHLPLGETATFELPTSDMDSLTIQVGLLPNHPVSGSHLSFALIVDGKEIGRYNYETYDRSEEWKQNVLRNQALRTVALAMPSNPDNSHTLAIKAVTEGVVLDEVYVVMQQ